MWRLLTTNQRMPTRTGEQVMTTEQQIKSAIDTLNEALELMKQLGFVTEGEEEE